MGGQVGHDRPRLLLAAGCAHEGGVERAGEFIDHLGRVRVDAVVVVFEVEGHAQQRLAEHVSVSRVQIQVVVAVGHGAAAGADVHGGAEPLGGGLLPLRTPGGRAARHGTIADGQVGVVAGRHDVAAHHVERPAVEVPVGVEVVDDDVGAASRYEGVERLALEEQVGRGAGLVAVVAADHALLRCRVVGLADA